MRRSLRLLLNEEDPHPVTGSEQRVPQIINTLPHSRTQTRGMLACIYAFSIAHLLRILSKSTAQYTAITHVVK